MFTCEPSVLDHCKTSFSHAVGALLNGKQGINTALSTGRKTEEGYEGGPGMLPDLLRPVPIEETTILVIEDDDNCRQAVVAALGSAGYAAFGASSAEEADQLARRVLPDAILLDIHLPGMNGVTYLQQMRAEKRSAGVPIILITAEHDEEVEIRGLDAGADDLIRKPFSQALLLARVRTHLRVRGLMLQLESQQMMLRNLACHDDLTGALTRRALLTELDSELSRAMRYGHPLSVLMVDLDGFKAVNDDHGHQAGDEVLREVVGRVAGSLREADRLGRWGGDEFAVVLPETDLREAIAVANRLRNCVRGGGLYEPEAHLQVALSVGVASLSLGFEVTANRLLSQADMALYEAKRKGRDRVCFHDEIRGVLTCEQDGTLPQLHQI